MNIRAKEYDNCKRTIDPSIARCRVSIHDNSSLEIILRELKDNNFVGKNSKKPLSMGEMISMHISCHIIIFFHGHKKVTYCCYDNCRSCTNNCDLLDYDEIKL
jgi:hypothetical protein